MNEIVAAWIGVAGAAFVGAAGWIFAAVANRRANQANALAAEANEHASRAAAAAERSAEAAAVATALAKSAEQREQHRAAQDGEHHFVEWVSLWNKKQLSLTFTNRGRDTAHDVSVTINGRRLNAVREVLQPIARDEAFVLEFPELDSQRNDFNRAADREWEEEKAGSGLVLYLNRWSDNIDVVVSWHSKLGRPQEQRLSTLIM